MSFLTFLSEPCRKITRKVRNLVYGVLSELFPISVTDPTVIPHRSRAKTSTRAKDLLGNSGERLAEDYLKNLGWKILERNLTLPSCEIDLIAFDHDQLVFVEVKTRRSDNYTEPLIEVDTRRQRKLIRASREFFRWRGIFDYPESRFDIVMIILPNDGKPRLHHIRNAFYG